MNLRLCHEQSVKRVSVVPIKTGGFDCMFKGDIERHNTEFFYDAGNIANHVFTSFEFADSVFVDYFIGAYR